jgi:hypothetical protein
MMKMQGYNGWVPVTPTIHKGWAANIENRAAAIEDAMSTSATPYCPVVSIRSRENAIAGKTLSKCQSGDVNKETGTYLAKNIIAVAGITL